MNFGRGGWGTRRWLRYVFKRPMHLGGGGPVVTFTFDDFPRSAYRIGGAMLQDFCRRGTFYAASDLMNSRNASGDQFTLDDLYSLVADGHELATHTAHHISSHAVSTAEFREDVREGREALRRIPGLIVSDNFAYPYGAMTVATKRALMHTTLSCRATTHGINRRVTDLSQLRANPLYGGTDQLSRVHRLLDDAEQSGGWLIFYTHDVSSSPSAVGCTPALLELALRSALDRSMKILTVDEVIAEGKPDVPFKLLL